MCNIRGETVSQSIHSALAEASQEKSENIFADQTISWSINGKTIYRLLNTDNGGQNVVQQ